MPQRPPQYAWAWLQRSRPVLAEAADRLTGQPPDSRFVDDLKERFEDDAFTRDVVIGAIADVAFSGRVPQRRPAGVSWDRGLIWWAATLAGTSTAEFEGTPDAGTDQATLFEPSREARRTAALDRRARDRAVQRLSVRSPDRAALVARLRDLLAQAEGDQVPADAVRDLIAEFE